MKKKLLELIVEALIAGAIVLFVYHASGAVSELRTPPMPPQKITEKNMTPIADSIAYVVQRAIERDQKQSENVANAFREIGRVFTSMETNGNFSVEFAEKEILAIQFPPESPVYAMDVKALILTFYRIIYAERMSSDRHPLDWLALTCRAMKHSISTGLKAAGREGV